MDVTEKFPELFVVAVIIDPKFRSYTLNSIPIDFFDDSKCKVIYSVIRDMALHDKFISMFSVREKVNLSFTIEENLKNSIIDFLTPYCLWEEKERGNLSHNGIFRSILDSVKPATEEVVSLTLARKALEKATYFLERGEIKQIYDLMRKVEKESQYIDEDGILLEEARNIQEEEKFVRGIPMGIHGEDAQGDMKWLDQTIYYKGIGRGQMALILGLSGTGKTTFMLNMLAHQAILGYKIYYYSLEMGIPYLVARLDSMLTGLPVEDVGMKTAAYQKEIGKITDRYPLNEKVRFFHFKEKSISPKSISSHLSRQKDHPDVIYVDYADLLKTPRQYTEKRHEIEDTMSNLRSLGDEYGCAVVSASQANRSKKEGKFLSKYNLWEGFAKSFNVDFLMSINIDIDKKTDVKGKSRVTHTPFVYVDKNRYGISGLVLKMESEGIRFFDPFPER